MKRFRSLVIGICLTAGLLTSGSVAVGQSSGTTQHNWPSPQAGQQQVGRPGSSSPATQSRITLPLDDGNRILLKGNIHPLARPEYDRGPVPDGLQMERMLLVLSRSPEQEAVLEKLLDEQQDPSSQNYHLWLTPGDFGQQFGPSDLDIQIVSTWLLSQGFRIDEVARGRAVIEFSGTAGLVRNTFHTELHKFVVNGEEHLANVSDPQIPFALAPVVVGVASLHNFFKHSHHIDLVRHLPLGQHFSSAAPSVLLGNGSNAIGPADFATIYNINGVYSSGITGAGRTIAVVARSNITIQDARDFRSTFGLPANDPTILVNGPDPGLVSGDDSEATLDTEWAGAVGRAATIKLVVSQSTATSDGVDLSAQYIVNNNVADIMTESYGLCEASSSNAKVTLELNLAQQATAQGITFLASTGDSGAEGCDNPHTQQTATGPISVELPAATPYTLAVGGTEFNEHGSPSTYWNPSGAALSYIPENVWNDSCAGAQCGTQSPNIFAGGGGASTNFSKPSWQTGVVGIPADGHRDIPDVSLSASASHDPYVVCFQGSCQPSSQIVRLAGGTSVSAPSFAGIMSLVDQKTSSRQGLPNTVLYALAKGETLSLCNGSNTSIPPASSCIFNDISIGTDAVPGEVAYGTANAQYQAGAGFDLATGLGSVNVTNLVNQWNSSTQTGFLLSVTISDTVGGGSGTVTSSPAGISCPGTCTAYFSPGTAVTLAAAPAIGFVFLKWSGACSGFSTCTVNMTAAQAVTAGFVACVGIQPTSQSYSSTGGKGAILVSAFSGNLCQWNASSSANWISITSNASSSGGTPVGYSVAANSGSLRTGTISFSGGPVFTVSQSPVGQDPRNLLTTVVGNGGNGSVGPIGDGGPATSASLSRAEGIAFDSSGNLFIADNLTYRIRRVDATTGVITTVAGNGTAGSSGDGGPATSAQINPVGVAVDRSNNIYIADMEGTNAQNSLIRKVDAKTGIITTVAGGGNGTCAAATDSVGDGCPATNANLTFFPVGGREIALDSLGNIFVADANNARLRRVDASTGIITTVAGNGFFGSSGDGGPAINSEVDAYGVALDSAGSIFLIKDSKIRRIDASTGIIQTFAGTGQLGSTGDGGPATMALLDFASGLVADSVGNVFIAENNGCHVRRVDSTTRIISTVAGNGTCGFSDASPATNAYLAAPNGLAFNSSGNLFIADSGNNRIRRLASDFSLSAANGSSISATVNAGQPAQFNLQVNPLDGSFGSVGMVALSCSGAPTQATCSVSQSSLVVGGSGAVAFTVQVSTSSRSLAPPTAIRRPPFAPEWPVPLTLLPLLFALVIGCLVGLRRPQATRAWALVSTLLVFAAMLAIASGCGGGTNAPPPPPPPPPSGTPAGTYTLTVTGTQQTVSHTLNLTLTVN